MKKITFFGDSICTGFGVSIHKGWVTRISAALEDYAMISNCSANGRTTRQALEVMPYEIQQHPPNILLIQFGLNDGNCWKSDNQLPRVSKGAFFANLIEMHDRAKRFGVGNVIYLTNHMTSGKLIVNYNNVIRDAAKEVGAVLIDIEPATMSKKNILSDGIHLSENGHDLYYELVYPVLRKMV